MVDSPTLETPTSSARFLPIDTTTPHNPNATKMSAQNQHPANAIAGSDDSDTETVGSGGLPSQLQAPLPAADLVSQHPADASDESPFIEPLSEGYVASPSSSI